MKQPYKIGHRGAKGYVAENTIESIQKAIDLGVHGIEIDVHLCASGELVVFHDFTLDRVTNGTGEIANHTLTQLKALKVYDTYQIPTLHEVMAIVDKGLLLNVELKGQHTGEAIAKFIAYYVKEKGWDWNDFVVSSFQNKLLKEVFKKSKYIPLGVLNDTNLEEAITIAKELNAVSVHPDWTMLTPTIVKQIQASKKKVFTYTVNEIAAVESMKKFGVDGIISDFPDRI